MHGKSVPYASPADNDMDADTNPPLLCFSHLRWDFVTQRPQHLMRQFAQEHRVFVWEEHIPCDHPLPYLKYHAFPQDDVIALRPRTPQAWSAEQLAAGLRDLLDTFCECSLRAPPVLWFYTPIMFAFAQHLPAMAVVYDCMDELSAFRFADPALLANEARLMARADLMFTGGYSLFEAKCSRHSDIHPFPSSVDVAYFAQAREHQPEPADQARIAHPRLGYYGVIDERIDLALIDQIAAARPDWQLVMVGLVVKLAASDLPSRPNIHWLGQKTYAELPAYMAGWDAALMPFAINAATRFISPTKTPEYLAGGLPVISTPIADVIRHYCDVEAVAIAADAASFIAACEAALTLPRSGPWRDGADAMVADLSWERTQAAMAAHLRRVLGGGGTAFRAAAIKRKEHYDTLIIGAGFAGSVMAERLANDAGQRVLVVDRRPHIAGNAFDEYDDAGVLIHRYGPHIFHTNSADVFDYLSRFTDWRPYEHRVLASVGDLLVPMPINRTTLNQLYGLSLQSDAEAEAYLASRAEPVSVIRTSEDVVVNAIGRELYETFFQGYMRKQWGIDPSGLDKSVTARVPTRTNTDDRYFTDKFQAMPAKGYTAMFGAMLANPAINLALGREYRDVIDEVDCDHIVFTGPIDEYFGFRYGKLPYRSLRFQHETHDRENFQSVATVNFPAEAVPYTRVTEYKHLTGQSHPKTSITYEYPAAEGDPYYPVPRPENQALFKRYEALANAEVGVTFVGRLATYRYYNMDQVVGQALATYRRMQASVEPVLTAAE